MLPLMEMSEYDLIPPEVPVMSNVLLEIFRLPSRWMPKEQPSMVSLAEGSSPRIVRLP